MYKIKFKSPTVEEQILFFTATEYVIEDGLITFTDKFGKTQTWKTTADYLANAYLMAKNETEKLFVRQQQDRLPSWKENICFTEKQVAWLEKITNHKYKGRIWKVRKK